MEFSSNIKINKTFSFAIAKFFLVYLLIFAYYISPIVTYASILSWFGGKNASAQAELVIGSSSTSLDSLAPANNSNLSPEEASPLIIENGEVLVSNEGPSITAPRKIISSDQISTYIVRSGDNLASIAKMFDVSVNTILWANDMNKSSVLKVGQTLVILPISGVLHTVVRGDTLSTIAKKYGGDVTEIASFNDLKVTDKLSIGDTVVIPDGQMSSSIRPSTVSGQTTSALISSASGPAYDNYYIKPFNGGVRTQGLHGYNAVDYGLPKGSSIFAAAKGEVIISKNSGWNGGYGNYIVIKHPNNTQTVYAHLTSSIVSVGQRVDQGQIIGYSGNTGKYIGPTGQHLHFEVRGAKNPF